MIDSAITNVILSMGEDAKFESLENPCRLTIDGTPVEVEGNGVGGGRYMLRSADPGLPGKIADEVERLVPGRYQFDFGALGE